MQSLNYLTVVHFSALNLQAIHVIDAKLLYIFSCVWIKYCTSKLIWYTWKVTLLTRSGGVNLFCDLVMIWSFSIRIPCPVLKLYSIKPMRLMKINTLVYLNVRNEFSLIDINSTNLIKFCEFFIKSNLSSFSKNQSFNFNTKIN